MSTKKAPVTMKPNSDPGVSKERYFKVLESYYQVSEDLKRVQDQFRAEYTFAEEKVNELTILNAFIKSDKEIEKKYKEYLKNANESAKK